MSGPRTTPLAPAPTVDRNSSRWQRLRHACGTDAANNIDLDFHADLVWLTVEASTQTNGPARTPVRERASGASQETS